jgi:transcription termination factor NusB
MVFVKTYSKTKITVAKPALPREEPPRRTQQAAAYTLLDDVVCIPGLMETLIAPCLHTRELVRLSSTCKALLRMARPQVCEVCFKRDVTRKGISLFLRQLARFPNLAILGE